MPRLLDLSPLFLTFPLGVERTELSVEDEPCPASRTVAGDALTELEDLLELRHQQNARQGHPRARIAQAYGRAKSSRHQ